MRCRQPGRQLPIWHASSKLSVREVERIIGFLMWLSAGFPIGRPHLGCLRAVLKHHKATYVRKRGECKRDQIDGPPRRPCSRGHLFLAPFLPLKWNRQRPVFLDFGPMVGPEVLWRYDASTDSGMGAVAWKIGSDVACFIRHEWTTAERKHAFVKDRVSTGVMEGMAAYRCANAFSKMFAGKRVLMEGDNASLTLGISRCSPTRLMMRHIHSVCSVVARHQICLRSAHVKGRHCLMHTCNTITNAHTRVKSFYV